MSFFLKKTVGPKNCHFEHHIDIIPNDKRRGSVVDHAFPELHSSKYSKRQAKNLIVLTRTKTDQYGRRHSVTVPLIPPSKEEKFEGGYHVERNPLTGRTNLVGNIPDPKSRRRGSQRRGSLRRGSLAEHDFPKLHVLTRNKMDRHGRRHTVAVPLLPPPEGENFDVVTWNEIV